MVGRSVREGKNKRAEGGEEQMKQGEGDRIMLRNERGKCILGSCLFAENRERQRQAWLLTVSVVEDDDASLLGLSLLWVYHGGADDKIH